MCAFLSLQAAAEEEEPITQAVVARVLAATDATCQGKTLAEAPRPNQHFPPLAARHTQLLSALVPAEALTQEEPVATQLFQPSPRPAAVVAAGLTLARPRLPLARVDQAAAVVARKLGYLAVQERQTKDMQAALA